MNLAKYFPMGDRTKVCMVLLSAEVKFYLKVSANNANIADKYRSASEIFKYLSGTFQCACYQIVAVVCGKAKIYQHIVCNKKKTMDMYAGARRSLPAMQLYIVWCSMVTVMLTQG